jgi:hypothetical protein
MGNVGHPVHTAMMTRYECAIRAVPSVLGSVLHEMAHDLMRRDRVSERQVSSHAAPFQARLAKLVRAYWPEAFEPKIVALHALRTL